MLLVVALASAHPGAGPGAPEALKDYIGHRVALEVRASEVELRYIAELPERRVLEDARNATQPGYAEGLLDELAGALTLTWNGEALPATRLPVAEPVAAGEGGFLNFSVAWMATLPGDQGRLGVRNGSHPDEPSFFATEVTLDGAWMADATSLLTVKDGRVRDNWHGAWVRDERGREPWLDLRPAAYWERADTPAPLPQRMTGLGLEQPPAWFLWGVLPLSLLPIGLIGRALGHRARRLRG